jgi:rhamnose utilization protein RhaD (predicted bifunctional aldolase and dehydrogenase)
MEMTNSPEVSRWYIAELTEEVTLEGDPQHVVHRKTRVIFADSAEDAYEKALSMITEHELNYLHEHNKAVRTRFWGLRELPLSNEDMDRAGILPKERLGTARRRNSTGLSPDQQFALLMSLKPGALPN